MAVVFVAGVVTAVLCTLIAGHVAGAFAATGRASKAAILRRAHDTTADEAVLSVLRAAPDRTYGHMRDLWAVLPDLPVEQAKE